MSDPYVLILSTIADPATDEIVQRLTGRGISHKRVNTEDYPFSRTLAFRPETDQQPWLTFDGVRLPMPTAVWYRRFRTPSRPDGMDEGIYNFCLHENRAAILGSIMGLRASWMSHPAAVWQAEYKPYQLRLAAELGLAIPNTIITNDPKAVRKAFTDFGAMVVKPTRTGHVTYKGEEYGIFTSPVLEQHLENLESARLSPSIYQSLVLKRFDVRVTIVGQQIFAAAIDSQSEPSAKIDWCQTTNPRLPHRTISLPEDIINKLLRMMEWLQLSYGAVDMIQTPSGEYVFLEVNPSGQWLWLDDELKLGISDAVAGWLAGPTSL